MKSIILIPISDYFASRKKVFKRFLFTLIVSLSALFFSILFNIGGSEKIVSIFSEFISTQISIVAILISFSVAIITILVSSDNNNIKRLKETESSKEQYKPVHGKQLYKLFFQFAYLNILLVFASLLFYTFYLCY